MLRQYVKIVKRADVVQTTGASVTAPNDLELGLECVYIYDGLIMAISKKNLILVSIKILVLISYTRAEKITFF